MAGRSRRAYRPRHHRTPLDHPRTAAGVAGRPPALPLPPAELEQLFLDEEVHDDLHAPGHRMALDALHDWQLDWPAVWAEANATMAERERVLAKDFLDRVESKPLTEEQAHAVICFDNRVQVRPRPALGKPPQWSPRPLMPSTAALSNPNGS